MYKKYTKEDFTNPNIPTSVSKMLSDTLMYVYARNNINQLSDFAVIVHEPPEGREFEMGCVYAHLIFCSYLHPYYYHCLTIGEAVRYFLDIMGDERVRLCISDGVKSIEDIINTYKEEDEKIKLIEKNTDNDINLADFL